MTPAAAEAAVPRNDPPEPKPGAPGYPESGVCRGYPGCGCWPLRLIAARRAYARHRAARRAAAESLAHAVEETCRPLFRLRRGACLRLQFLDTCIGALERLVLQQRRLHQRVNGMRRAPQTVGDQALGLRIALCVSSWAKRLNNSSTSSYSCGVMASLPACARIPAGRRFRRLWTSRFAERRKPMISRHSGSVVDLHQIEAGSIRGRFSARSAHGTSRKFRAQHFSAGCRPTRIVSMMSGTNSVSRGTQPT